MKKDEYIEDQCELNDELYNTAPNINFKKFIRKVLMFNL